MSPIDQLRHIATVFMTTKGMPSLVINAPEDSEDVWRIYPSGEASIGQGKTLEAAIEDAMSHPQMPEYGSRGLEGGRK